MRQYPAITLLCLLPFAAIDSSNAADTPYANTVMSLQPTYYYELNEPDATGGVTDSMGNAPAGSYNGDYENGAPEAGCDGPLFINEGQDGTGEFEYYETEIPGVGGEENLAHCSNNEGHILLGPSEAFGASDITVAFFFRADFAQGGDRLFTNNLDDPETSFQVNVANDGLLVAVNPLDVGEFAERTLTTDDGAWDRALIQADYGWFHVVASTSGGEDDRAENIQVWVNGINRTENLIITEWGWGVDTDSARIGGRREDPLDSTTHSGAQDEVAIWLDRVLTEEEVQSLWAAAIGDIEPPITGDYNNNGELDAPDLDLQALQIVDPNPDLATYDLNDNGAVNFDDRKIWVGDLKNTWIGDANLDLEFNSSDMVQAFVGGKYETGETAGWEEGDWNGDTEFGSGDMVAAFVDGGYELGAKPAAVSAVPEPSSALLSVIALATLAVWRRRD